MRGVGKCNPKPGNHRDVGVTVGVKKSLDQKGQSRPRGAEMNTTCGPITLKTGPKGIANHAEGLSR